MKVWVFILGLAVGAMPCLSDVVTLKNGRTLDGVVESETEGQVVLSIGVGKVTLEKKNIRSIQRDESAAKAMTESWKRQYFADDRFVPDRFRALAATFRHVDGLRQSALKSESDLADRSRKAAKAEKEFEQVRNEHIAVSRALASIPTNDLANNAEALTEYNEQVFRQNALQAKLVLLRSENETAVQAADTHRTSLVRYLESASRLRDEVASKVPDAMSADEQLFWGELTNRVASFASELHTIEVPYDDDGGHAILDVTINGRGKGRFLLDTGATLVVLSKSLADALKLERPSRPLQTRLADGRTADAYPCIIDSLQVGDARVDHVEAIIMDQPPAPGIDGLLGLSFLRDFVVHYDPANGQLELVRFDSTK